MNTRAKGRRIVNKCKIELVKMGYLVGEVERTSRFIKVKDLFGLFDLVAIKPGNVVFVQVTTNRPHTHKKYLAFTKLYGSGEIWVEQWCFYDYKGFKRYKYYPRGNYETENRTT